MSDKTIDEIINGWRIGWSTGGRTREQAAEFLTDFQKQIGITGPITDLKPPMLTYIVEVILPIGWYRRKIYIANVFRGAYLLISVLLVLAIPLVVAFLPTFLQSPGIARWFGTAAPTASTPAASVTVNVVAQLTAVLAGVLALQKTIGGWLSTQQQYAAWWKTSSDLKKLWYGLQTKWSTTKAALKTATVDGPGLENEMAEQVAQARTLISDEEYEFFKNLTLPNVDILDALTKAQTSVTSLVTPLLPGLDRAKTFAREADTYAVNVFRAKQDIEKYTLLLTDLNTRIDYKTNEFETATEAKRTALKAELDALGKKRAEIALSLLDAKATAAAYEKAARPG